MALFETTCNLVLHSEEKSLLVGDTIDLTKERAEEINKAVKGVFPDIPQALILVESNEASAEKPKRGRKKAAEDAEAES